MLDLWIVNYIPNKEIQYTFALLRMCFRGAVMTAVMIRAMFSGHEAI